MDQIGTLYYGSGRLPIKIDDRVLSHIKMVIASKLRRREAFLLSWPEPEETGGGRTSVWIHPHADLGFRFDGGRSPELDTDLLDRLAVEASTSRGILINEAQSPRSIPGLG
ncbi:MAG TPA: hypothetical protein VK595_06705 [Vicinamibacterales bacterium]|nr:hypothetical protein [Vicinamibacterales bacterium]